MSQPSWDERLRDALQQCLDAGWTLNALAAAAEVPYTTLYVFINGSPPKKTTTKKGAKKVGKAKPKEFQQLKSDNFEKLATFVGMTLTKPQIPRP